MTGYAPDGPGPTLEGLAPPALLRLQEWMQENAVTGVELEFDGYGDEGRVDLRSVSPPEALDMQVGDRSLADFARRVGYDVLHEHRRGWEIDTGSNGTVSIGPDEATLAFGRYEQELALRDPDDLSGSPATRKVQAWMRANNVERVELECSGYSDEGNIQLRHIVPETARHLDVGDGTSFDRFAVGFAAGTVSHHYRGWETNEGGNGTVTITPDEATLHMGFYEETTVYDPPLRLVGLPAPDTSEP